MESRELIRFSDPILIASRRYGRGGSLRGERRPAGTSLGGALIDAYVGLKNQEITRYRMSTHPCELDMYYSV